MYSFLAQHEQDIGTPIEGIGELGTSANAPSLFSQILTMVIGLLTLIAGVWFIFLLITGGIAWMSSGGDQAKLAAARSKMFSGAVGLAIVVAALFLAEIFGGLIGLGDILDPAGEITRLR